MALMEEVGRDSPVEPGEFTRLLRESDASRPELLGRLLPLVHDELRRVAGGYVGRLGDAAPTLQPTVLVNEAYLRLSGTGEALGPRDRGHFCAIAARAMRNSLVDHLRARNAQRRGGGAEQVTLSGVAAALEERGADPLELDEALRDLEELDPELGELVELRYFAGLSIPETAEALDLSTATVERRWRTARAFLRDRLEGLS